MHSRQSLNFLNSCRLETRGVRASNIRPLEARRARRNTIPALRRGLLRLRSQYSHTAFDSRHRRAAAYALLRLRLSYSQQWKRQSRKFG